VAYDGHDEVCESILTLVCWSSFQYLMSMGPLHQRSLVRHEQVPMVGVLPKWLTYYDVALPIVGQS